MHIEILENINVKKVLEEANTVKVAVNKGWENIEQVGLQGHKPKLDPLKECYASVGKVSKLQFPENYFKYPIWKIPTINRIMEKYGMVRTRIMQSQPKTCLTIHRDLTKRIHIPIITNPNCFMMIDGQVHILQVGKVYLTNTTVFHTAVNASTLARVHIVGCVYD